MPIMLRRFAGMMIGLSVGIIVLMSQMWSMQLQRTPPDITAPPSPLPARDALRIPGTPFIDAVMKHDPEFDLNSIPLTQWLDARDSQEIPWKTRIENAELRMDQRLEVAYSATLQPKDVNNLAGDLYFIAGVTDAAGKSLVPPKVVHRSLDGKIPEDKELRFNDMCGARGLPVTRIGVVDGDSIELQGEFELPLEDLRTAHEETIPALLK